MGTCMQMMMMRMMQPTMHCIKFSLLHGQNTGTSSHFLQIKSTERGHFFMIHLPQGYPRGHFYFLTFHRFFISSIYCRILQGFHNTHSIAAASQSLKSALLLMAKQVDAHRDMLWCIQLHFVNSEISTSMARKYVYNWKVSSFFLVFLFQTTKAYTCHHLLLIQLQNFQ